MKSFIYQKIDSSSKWNQFVVSKIWKHLTIDFKNNHFDIFFYLKISREKLSKQKHNIGKNLVKYQDLNLGSALTILFSRIYFEDCQTDRNFYSFEDE